MNTLIVHSHPERQSFNSPLTKHAVKVLGDGGHIVEVSDLYAMKFKAVADPDDFVQREEPTFIRLDQEQTFAHNLRTTAPDIAAEQAKVERAEVVIFQYPIWFFGMPATRKGWVDRGTNPWLRLPTGEGGAQRPCRETQEYSAVPRLYFHPRKDYGTDERLLPSVEPRSGFQHKPHVVSGSL